MPCPQQKWITTEDYLIKKRPNQLNLGEPSDDTSLYTYDRLMAVIHILKTFPYEVSIEEIETLNLSQYRQALSGMNLIIYIVRQNTLYIHIIIDNET